MKYFAPLLVLAALFTPLTSPDGRTVYVNPDHVSAVRVPTDSYCTRDAHALISTDQGNLCVAEDAEDVRRKLQETSNGMSHR